MGEGPATPLAQVREPVIQTLDQGSHDYPGCLADLNDRPGEPGAPSRLYAVGDLCLLRGAPRRLVAIVGTREASGYGLRVARALGRAFAEAGVTVVSGMARGIDSAAHLGALEAGGKTIAVLGTGPDVPYPVGNRELHGRICAGGLVLSESEPGRGAFQGSFPRRNRIIAALARATIVVEAGYKSGALNTAAQALQLGRGVGAVPGMIDLPRSMGSNQLMRDGGQVVGSVADALSMMSVSEKRTVPRPTMSSNEAEVWDDIQGCGPTTPDDLAALTGLDVREVLAALSNLELVGLVRRESDGRIVRADIATVDLT